MAPTATFERESYLADALSPQFLAGVRAQEMGDLIAGLGDMTQTVQELALMVGQAEGEVRGLTQAIGGAPRRQSTWGRRLDAEANSADLARAQGRLRRLREALRDTQDAMERLGQDGAPSHELTALRMQCQQDELRAQACEAELSHLVQQLELLGTEMGANRRRQDAERRRGQAGPAAAQALPMAGVEGQGAGTGEPPEAIRPELDNVVLQVRQMLHRKIRAPKGEPVERFDDPATSQEMAAIQGGFAKAMQSAKMPRFADPSDLVQWVIRQAHTDGAQDLRGYAAKLHFSTQLKTMIRDELARARQFRSDHAASLKEGDMTAAFDRQRISRDPVIGEDGMPRVRPMEPVGEITRVEEMDAHIADLQNMLASTGDDMQISQLELQNMTQRQQQVMNVLSNLSKTLHETSMAIIRKIGT